MNEEKDEFSPGELMRRAIAGDHEAFGIIYNAYFSQIYRYVYFRVRDKSAAEDIVQSVFLKVFAKLPSYEERARPPLAYLFTVARNKIIDHWRKNKPIELAGDNDFNGIPDPAETAEETVSRAVAMEKISRALEDISADQREVIILKFLNELSYREIAEISGKNETAVRKLASRGLKKLRQYFKQKNIQEP
ncbi:MAG TPA: RNA polymerase sigma factor [Candidatus Nanoarchaeia archaeon]|nr:RNA polymerase sigma factor [Candidatus Nanoarchaeia archaeon]